MVELRSTDGQRFQDLPEIPAFWTGLLYDPESRAAVLDLLGDVPYAAHQAAQAGDAKTARPIFQKLATGSNDGYRAAALMMEGNLAAQRKDDKAAIAAYQTVIDDKDLPEPFRNLALLRQTALQFDSISPDQVIARLKPLAIEGNPWFGPAGEMTAMAYVKQGKTELAGTLFGALAKDKTVPESTRQRTRQLAGVYGVDAVQDDESPAGAAPQLTAPAAGEGAN